MSDTSTVAVAASDQAAAQAVPGLIVAAWAANDADAFARAFAPDGTMLLPGDVYLKGRDAIRDFMAAGYEGPYKGSTVTGTPLDARFLSPTSAVVVTVGGVLLPGDAEVSDEQEIRATWVLAKYDGEWLIGAYHNSRTQA
jgi:uncharacterized protein (TIGR02246 family)